MFDLFADTLSAVNQLAAFMGALACWGLGGWLVGSAVYWRLHAGRGCGEVIRVRQEGNRFNSGDPHLAPPGGTREGASDAGAGGPPGPRTGPHSALHVS